MKVAKRTPDKLEKNKIGLSKLLTFYDAYLRNPNLTFVASVMQITPGTLSDWINRYPSLKKAKEFADSARGSKSSFRSYVFEHLSEEASEVWEKIQFWYEQDMDEDRHEKKGTKRNTIRTRQKVMQLLSSRGKPVRQEIFIHALVTSNFDMSSALRITGTSRSTLYEWMEEDEFRKLVQEIEFHKKNFFEKALLDLVGMGNPAAVIHVNKTVNADRGYGDKVELNHTGSISMAVSFEDLEPYMSIDIRKGVLEAMRKREEEQQKTIEAEVVGERRALPSTEQVD